MKISAVLLASLMPVLGEYVPVKYQFLNILELERYGIYSGDSKLKDHIIYVKFERNENLHSFFYTCS